MAETEHRRRLKVAVDVWRDGSVEGAEVIAVVERYDEDEVRLRVGDQGIYMSCEAATEIGEQLVHASKEEGPS